MTLIHVPVLLKETIASLDLGPGKNVLDGTVGLGGHAAAILDAVAPDGNLLGLDRDEAALVSARSALMRFGSRAMLVRASYADAAGVVRERSFGPIHGSLLDLGYSSLEIDDPSRGFSFRTDGPLDMRFDQRQDLDAATIVNHDSLDALSKIIWEYGEERYARKIAAAICKARREAPVVSTGQLANVIWNAVPQHYRRGRIHPATRTFQALRIAVNDELGSLSRALPELLPMLAPGGRLAVISFHSLEDRIVKNFFRDAATAGTAETLTKRPITASAKETAENPRSRSAKLRVLKKH